MRKPKTKKRTRKADAMPQGRAGGWTEVRHTCGHKVSYRGLPAVALALLRKQECDRCAGY